MMPPTKVRNEDILLGWLDFLVKLGAPWAEPVVAGLRLIVGIAKENPSWTPQIPQPPSNGNLAASLNYADILLELDKALLASPPPCVDYEKLSELLGYRDLWRLYPDLNSRWILPSETGGLKAPFVELWSNIDPFRPDLPVRFIPAQDLEYRPPMQAQAIAALISDLIAGKFRKDEPKLRIRSFKVENDCLCLEFAFCRYTDYLRTNWAVANLDASSAKRLRIELCGIGTIFPLEESGCANDLGVSAIVAFEDEILLPASSNQVISSPDMIIPSVSGSADFLGDYWLGQVPWPAQDIVREAAEELGIDAIQFRDASVRLLALTRNVLRGGKPEAFYYIRLPSRRESFSNTFEHRPDAFVRLPTLLDKDRSPVSNFEQRAQEISKFISEPSHKGAVISPFARVALHYYLLYAKRCSRTFERHNGLP